MKSNSLTVPVTGSWKRVQVSNPFTWTNVLKLVRVLPFENAKIATLEEIQFYIAAALFGSLLTCFILFIVPFVLYVFR